MGCASYESSVTLLDLARVMKSLKKWKILPTAKKVRVVSFIGLSYDEINSNIVNHSKKYHGHKCGVFPWLFLFFSKNHEPGIITNQGTHTLAAIAIDYVRLRLV